jgi:hypothetical protein
MTTATILITDAFREGNLIPVGKQPTTAEQTEALTRLNAYISSVFGYEMGENLSDWQVPAPQRTASQAANFPQMPFPTDIEWGIFPLSFANDPSIAIWPFPPKNSRIVFGSVANTVFFPEAPEDGCRMAVVQGSGAGDGGSAGQVLTLDGNGRFIEGSATKTYAAPVTARQWLYRADLGNWIAVVPLAIGDDCPFPAEFDDLWVTRLFMRFGPRYGKVISTETADVAKAALARLKARYRQAGTTVYGSGDFPRSLQSYISGRWMW